MLGTGILIVLKMLLPILFIIIAISAALKALRGYENKSKRQLEIERKKTVKMKKTIAEQSMRLERQEQRKSENK